MWAFSQSLKATIDFYQALLFGLVFSRPLEILELRCIAFTPIQTQPHSDQSGTITWFGTFYENPADNGITVWLACLL